MKKGNSNLMSFLLGTALGVGAGLYLNSKHGREMRNQTLEKLKDYESEIEDKVDEALDKLKGKVNSLVENIREKTEHLN